MWDAPYFPIAYAIMNVIIIHNNSQKMRRNVSTFSFSSFVVPFFSSFSTFFRIQLIENPMLTLFYSELSANWTGLKNSFYFLILIPKARVSPRDFQTSFPRRDSLPRNFYINASSKRIRFDWYLEKVNYACFGRKRKLMLLILYYIILPHQFLIVLASFCLHGFTKINPKSFLGSIRQSISLVKIWKIL